MRSQQRDTGAFSQLVARTQTGVFNLAYSILHNREEAEDLTQEVCLRVWRALPQFRGDSKFSTWLYRITTNLCLNRRRQLRAYLRVVDDDAVIERMAAQEQGPVDMALEADQRKRVWAAVARLPDKYRLVIALFYQEQLSYKEVAQILSLPLGTVKSHLSRARKALARILQPDSESQHAAL